MKRKKKSTKNIWLFEDGYQYSEKNTKWSNFWDTNINNVNENSGSTMLYS